MPASAIRVWDPLVRVVHWSVACLVVMDLVNEAGANPWHRYLGYACGALVAVRLAWGVIGTPYARLSSIATSARRIGPYLTRSASREVRLFHAGHNPLGAWMALVLWGLILLAVATGWMLQLDAFWGDEAMQTAHAAASYALAGCAVLHVAGVLVTSVLQRTNLVKAMITGSKNPGLPN